ncbi:MAG: S24 family peptidase [Dinoroseobacter sp.]|nr:S24 family peptidase [Dinoroseobacter sp.]
MPGSGDLMVDGVQYERLSRFEVDASAGPGAIRSVDQTVDSILVTSSWLNKLGVSGDLAGLVNVRGDSMVPTIPDHSRVLIDFADRELRRDGDIFAVTLDNDFLLKRLSRFEVEGKAGYVMTSDNPSYPPRSVSAETHNYFRIVGRVRAIISEVDT